MLSSHTVAKEIFRFDPNSQLGKFGIQFLLSSTFPESLQGVIVFFIIVEYNRDWEYMRMSSMNTITNLSKYGLHTRFMRSMNTTDELRHTDNTTLVPPRFLDTLSQVYHRRRPTLGLLILPPVSPFPTTIRRTARISIPPIEPNLAERARISAINLDDYQFDPLTPPPSPSTPFTIAAYQRMILETDPTPREEALTENIAKVST
ncbi:hypothetical protein Tco_0347925 [Tanacetum coccineum]